MHFMNSRPDVVRSISQRWLLSYWDRLRGVRRTADVARVRSRGARRHGGEPVVPGRGRERRRRSFLDPISRSSESPKPYGSVCQGRFLDEILPPRYREAALSTYHRVLVTRLPVYTIADTRDRDGRIVHYERLLLPFSRDGVASRPDTGFARNGEPGGRVRQSRHLEVVAEAAGLRALHDDPALTAFRDMGGARLATCPPRVAWLGAVVVGRRRRGDRRPARRRPRSDPRHGDRAPDRHRAQSAGAAAAVPGRHRVLPEDDLALGGRVARPADRARRDRGARMGDGDPGDRRDGRHARRRFPARARLRTGARATARWRAPAPPCAAPPPRSRPRSSCPTTRARRPTSPSSWLRSMRCRPWRWCSIRSSASALGFDAATTGVMLGATIHDVAQVVGAGYAVSEATGNTAVIVKLFRVLLMLPVVLVIGWLFARRTVATAAARIPIPVFALVFVGLCVLNSIAAAFPAIAPSFARIKAPLIEASTWGLLDCDLGARPRHVADRHRRARLAPCRDGDRHDARHPGDRDRRPADAAVRPDRRNRRSGIVVGVLIADEPLGKVRSHKFFGALARQSADGSETTTTRGRRSTAVRAAPLPDRRGCRSVTLMLPVSMKL